ncbi:MAG: redoxin domain-containing protein [Methylococcaceae bacterium]|nr:redoxin domain-containing protein [Methylococcaceae bacterium]
MKAQVGQKAPLLAVSEWVQGQPSNFDQLMGHVVLVEVFQVNCPGCFLYALPQAVKLYQKYSSHGLIILGVATAFEDFDKNNLKNLQRLMDHGEVIGETQKWLSQHDQLIGNHLPFRIPFPVAMDRLRKRQNEIPQAEMATFINDRIPNFQTLPESEQHSIWQRVQNYFQALEYHAETFETFDLKGTPSHILVDQEGILRQCSFGAGTDLEADIVSLLNHG